MFTYQCKGLSGSVEVANATSRIFFPKCIGEPGVAAKLMKGPLFGHCLACPFVGTFEMLQIIAETSNASIYSGYLIGSVRDKGTNHLL